MIPKIIHYCWFGKGKKTRLMRRCISSWRAFFPDYQIIEWNEDNFDLKMNPYVRYCYENRKWAYLSDYVRLIVIYQYGGIYFDTDVEVIASFENVMKEKAFYAFENSNYIATGLGFGAEAGHITTKKMIDEYDVFMGKTDQLHYIGCPILNTKAMTSLGLRLNGKEQYVENARILPSEYMNPLEDATGRLNKTGNTISIHWYSKSALSRTLVLKSKMTRYFHRIFGVRCFDRLKR